MLMCQETEVLLKEAEALLPKIDRIFLSNSVTPTEAKELIGKGEELLLRLKSVEEPGMRMKNAAEVLETAIALAKGEMEDEKEET